MDLEPIEERRGRVRRDPKERRLELLEGMGPRHHLDREPGVRSRIAPARRAGTRPARTADDLPLPLGPTTPRNRLPSTDSLDEPRDDRPVPRGRRSRACRPRQRTESFVRVGELHLGAEFDPRAIRPERLAEREVEGSHVGKAGSRVLRRRSRDHIRRGRWAAPVGAR